MNKLNSDKEYGRQKLNDEILNLINKNKSSSVVKIFITGESGVGKTSLVNNVLSKLSNEKTIVLSAKYDLLNVEDNNTIIFKLISQFSRELLTLDAMELASWRKYLLSGLGHNAKVLVDLSPDLGVVLGYLDEPSQLGPIEAMIRQEILLVKFFELICEKSTSRIIVFLDDLQWSTAKNVSFIEQLLNISNLSNLVFLGSYRDSISHDHQILSFINKQRDIEKILVPTLEIESILEILKQAYGDFEEINSLAKIIKAKTAGNPFHIIQFLKHLEKTDLCTLSDSRAYFKLDLIENEKVTENVVEILLQDMRKLSKELQDFLSICSILGNRVRIKLLNHLYDGEIAQLELLIDESIKRSYFVQNDSTDLFFSHDRIQEAAYELLDINSRTLNHRKIALLLHKNYLSGDSHALIDSTIHFNKSKLLVDANEFVIVSALNFDSCLVAKKSSSFQMALEFCEASLYFQKLATNDSKPVNNFKLEIELAELYYLNGYYDKSETFIVEALNHYNLVIEKSKFLNLLSIQYTAQGKYSYAIKAGKEALNLLDVKLPEIISPQTVEAALAEVEVLIGNKEVKDLVNIEEMTDDKNQLIMNILINMDSPCYLSDIDLYCIIVSKMVCFSIEYGLVAQSAKAFASYAIVSCSYDKFSLGLEFSKVGIKIAERFNHLGQLCRVCHTMANHVQYWSEPISLGDSINDRGFVAGHDAGEYLWAGFIKLFKPYNQFFASRNLNLIVKDVDEGLLYCKEHPNQLGIDSLTGLSLIIEELSDPNASFDVIINKHKSYVDVCHKTNSLMALSMYLSLKSFVLLLKGELSLAKKVNDQSLGLSKFSYSLVSNVYDDFVCCLLALYEASDRNSLDADRFNLSFSKIKKISDSAPSNFKGLFFIIDAEYQFLCGNFYDGVEALESAIEICSKSTMYSFEAYALKRLAYHWARVKKKSDIAKYYDEQSFAVFQKWGALNLIKNKKYTNIANTIGEQGINLFLDNSKSSQEIESSEEYFKNSLKAFVNLLNADAARFYIKNEQDLFELRSSHGLFEDNDYMGIVNYASRTGNKLTKTDLLTIGLADDSFFREDEEIVFFPCDSLAVFVFIKNKRDWNYNENISLVNILLQQMSLYLRNRELVKKVSDFNTALEEQVDMRTRELKNERDKAQSISDDLRKTQRDLVESAKSAGRSEIAANIIHNLGNGLMFAAGQVELLELYLTEEESSASNDKIKAGVSKLSRKMHEMIKLIKNEKGINKSYVVKELCDVEDLINESFTFSKGNFEIQHKIKNSLKFPVALDIEKIKNILINIYSNAFFACSNLSYEPLIVTEIQIKEAKLEIKIVDNGIGISKDSLKLLFNPGYTTKGNQGTGYGLHNSSVILGHMGGCIIAESDGVNMGASFTIILPI